MDGELSPQFMVALKKAPEHRNETVCKTFAVAVVSMYMALVRNVSGCFVYGFYSPCFVEIQHYKLAREMRSPTDFNSAFLFVVGALALVTLSDANDLTALAKLSG